jgi:hypothetical protein
VLAQRGIRRGADLGHQRGFGLWADPPSPAGTRGGHHPARLLASSSPPFDRALANAEEAGRLGLRETGVDGSQQPLAEVGRILLHHPSLAQGQLFRNPL